jgi:hypothetical protein
MREYGWYWVRIRDWHNLDWTGSNGCAIPGLFYKAANGSGRWIAYGEAGYTDSSFDFIGERIILLEVP